MRNVLEIGVVVLLVLGCRGNAAEENLESQYELSTEGSTSTVASGAEGHLVLTIRPKGEAHVSEEAPVKISLSGEELSFAKSALGREDAQHEPGHGPRFDARFRAGKGPAATAEARVTFFLCLKDLCARQQRTISFAVQITPGKS